MSDSPDLSIVVPVLNESENIERLYAEVVRVFKEQMPQLSWELVVTDNCSTDDTFDKLERIAALDDRVRAFRFARNFGYQRSIMTGYLFSRGRAAVQLDADLQDPPSLIPQMVELWQQGAQVVYGVRTARGTESKVLSGARKVFYRLVDGLSDDDLPHDAGDFRLIDRSVIETMRYDHDANPYVRGSIAALGFHQVGFEYERSDRVAGETKFSPAALFRLATDGILNHSTRPLQLASVTAVVAVIASFLGFAGYLFGNLFFGQDWPAGFTTLILLQLVALSLNAAFLGIIGAYVGRLFRQSKAPPLVVIHQSTDAMAPSVVTSSQPIVPHPLLRTQFDTHDKDPE